MKIIKQGVNPGNDIYPPLYVALENITKEEAQKVFGEIQDKSADKIVMPKFPIIGGSEA